MERRSGQSAHDCKLRERAHLMTGLENVLALLALVLLLDYLRHRHR